MTTLQVKQILAMAEQGQTESQFLMSQICLQNKDLEGMVHWLLQSGAKEFPDALGALGHCYEKGLGISQDYAAAMAHYDRGVKGGSGAAAYHKAELLYKSRQGPESHNQICDLLITAAKTDFIPALRAIAYLAIQRVSSRAMGLSCLRRAARHGDPVSSFTLGWCLLQDRAGNESEHEAKQCLQLASRAQYPFADSLLVKLQNVKSAADQQTPDDPIEWETSFSLYPEPTSIDHQVLNSDPAVTLFDEVLNIVDCAYLIFVSRPHMRRADVVDPDSRKDGMVSDVRTSMSTYLPFSLVDIISRHVELKIIGASGANLMLSEPMSILHYAPGQYYRPHVDYFDPKLTVSKELLEDGGQRTASAITYLAAPSVGGGTSFPRLDLSVSPSAGSTLWFRNCFEDMRVDDRSLHAGDPVEAGDKWVVTKWFREKQTRYLEF
jgi:hypothetical protein